ncbi:hypothetical protein COB21_00070 [Candidatus Aerophobetes bacterium]|uniref:Lipid A biosynthesis acyltransferase n=1 Tax=Aerophobetes bacterium TaxID=2030807 RepID=A0A2A4X9B2_UNCAE|nr:MAG: hypothetical protein COB21_00070 [Candidatus Aerophobetes bacterium]
MPRLIRQIGDFIAYILIRIIFSPLALMPISWIHAIGNKLGLLLFYLLKGFRKKTLSNLSLAQGIVKDEKHLLKLAKESFQNLAITVLEYGKLPFVRDINKVVECENPEEAQELINQGTGLIFFVGHQANWELLFLEGTNRMPGVAIGRPINNSFLYRYVVRMRERFGGKIFEPKQGLKEGLRALKSGKFLGIVGDQAFPSGNFTSSFLGINAYTSTAPALLAYKTGSPIITASIVRVKNKYKMHFSNALFPNKEKPINEEVEHMMHVCLAHLEKSIRKNPGQWLWQHNRWKQEPASITYYKFRKNPILIILPRSEKRAIECRAILDLLKTIYPKAFLTLWAPHALENSSLVSGWNYKTYKAPADLFIRDYKFQLVFNFSNQTTLKNHFLSLSASEVIDHQTLFNFAKKENIHPDNTVEVLKKLLTRPGALDSFYAQ